MEGSAHEEADLPVKGSLIPCFTGLSVRKGVNPNDLGAVKKRSLLFYCPLAYLDLPFSFPERPPFHLLQANLLQLGERRKEKGNPFEATNLLWNNK